MMTDPKCSDFLGSFYDYAIKVSIEDLERISPDSVYQKVKRNFLLNRREVPEEIQVANAKAFGYRYIVLAKIAKASDTKGSFITSIIENDFPAVQLNPFEMQMASGGFGAHSSEFLLGGDFISSLSTAFDL